MHFSIAEIKKKGCNYAVYEHAHRESIQSLLKTIPTD